jgi:hypothetical protein
MKLPSPAETLDAPHPTQKEGHATRSRSRCPVEGLRAPS